MELEAPRTVIAQAAQQRTRYLTAAGSAALIAVALLFGACGEQEDGQSETWQRQGQLLAWDREVWIVDATPIVVPESLDVTGERVLGSMVDAKGEYDDEGRMVAHAITLTTGALPDATLAGIEHAGVIASTSETVWVVGDSAVLLADGVAIGMPDGIDVTALASGEYVATVRGHGFGENTIIASEIMVTGAQTQDGNTAPVRPAVTVEQQQEPQPSQPEAPAQEPDPSDNAPLPEQPSRTDQDGDGDRDDDDDDEKKQKKEREPQEKDDKDKDEDDD